MSRQDANAAFALSSFLQGANATYIDELYARYENSPASVDPEWQEFFKSLKDTPADVQKNAEGPSWAKANWPLTPNDDLTSALDGNWAQVEKVIGTKLAAKAQVKGVDPAAAVDVNQATRDSVRALMLIRAYRMRGHFYAKLDPLGLEPARDREELDPRTYGFTEADYDRKIFLDHVLGLDYANLREIVAILDRTYCQTLGVEFMHISNGTQKGWIQERIEGPDKEISFTREGRRAILTKLIEAEALGAGELEVGELLEAFRLDQLVEDRALALAREADLLVRPFDTFLNPALLSRIGNVHELHAKRLAIGALADRDNLVQRCEFKTEHVVEENLAIEIGFGEAVGPGVEFLVIPRRLETERIELGVEVAAHAIGSDQHQGAD
jgi:hypothetical protein